MGVRPFLVRANAQSLATYLSNYIPLSTSFPSWSWDALIREFAIEGGNDGNRNIRRSDRRQGHKFRFQKSQDADQREMGRSRIRQDISHLQSGHR